MFDQLRQIMVPAPITEFIGVPAGEMPELLRQLLDSQHGRATDQYRYDRDILFQSPSDLQTDEIPVRIIQASLAILVDGG